MSIGKNIKYYRIQKGLTQKKLAALTGLAEITIRQYESEKYEPKRDNLLKIIKALDINQNQLLKDTKEAEQKHSYHTYDTSKQPPLFYTELLKESHNKANEDFFSLLSGFGYEIVDLEDGTYHFIGKNGSVIAAKEELKSLECNIRSFISFITDQFYREKLGDSESDMPKKLT